MKDNTAKHFHGDILQKITYELVYYNAVTANCKMISYEIQRVKLFCISVGAYFVTADE